MAEEEDAWDAFGSDSDEEEEERTENNVETDQSKAAANFICSTLVQNFAIQNSQVAVKDRRVLIIGRNSWQVFADALRLRQLHVFVQANVGAFPVDLNDNDNILENKNGPMMDAILYLGGGGDDLPIDINMLERYFLDAIQHRLCPGGTLFLHHKFHTDELVKRLRPYGRDEYSVSFFGDTPVFGWQTVVPRVHAKNTCPWLPSSHIVESEVELVQDATISLSAHECITSRLTDNATAKAVEALQQYGYCILPGLLDQNDCQEWGQAVLDSVHDAAKILKDRDHVDIYNPHASQSEPQSYQELSMREDLRLDIRQGPGLWKLRQKIGDEKGNESLILKGSESANGAFLRGHPSILEILRRTMNPHDAQDKLWKGNMGRWNFGGSGADGSFQDLRLSPVGGIVSLPGAADQALHADTPHLFENIPDLPAHYINVFAPCTPWDEKVGGTAFVHGSHNLEFTAKYCGEDNVDNSQVYPFLVRPKLNMGDVILFDCRILHFGLANTSENVERCICYTNTWQNWFHDAKNWDQNRAIFDKEGAEEEES